MVKREYDEKIIEKTREEQRIKTERERKIEENKTKTEESNAKYTEMVEKWKR